MSVRFTERMRGFHTPGAPAFDAGYWAGRWDWNRLAFELTIGTDDLATTLADPTHPMDATGRVRCTALSAVELPVVAGRFELFVPGHGPGRSLMRYRLPLETPDGPLTLLGVKEIGDDRGLDLWSDTTTLHTRLVTGNADFDAPVSEEYSRGILRLTAPMFARQLLTLRGTPSDVARFGRFFATRLVRTYRGRARAEVPR